MNNMLKAIIIEDEIGSVNVILQLLAEFGQNHIQVLGVADAIQPGLEFIKTHQPDVVFMDIELRDGSSFQILNQLDKIDFKLIFITAFDKFAIDAFRYSALDYLLKPIDNLLFKEALDKIINKSTPIHSQKQYDFLKEIREHNVVEKIDKLALVEQNEICFESLDQILCLIANESYTHIHTLSGKKYTMSKNLGHYQELLSTQPNFYRIHYSTIVNIDHIRKITKNESNRQYKIELKNGKLFEVSQRRVSEFKKIFDILK
jgi:two-component system LytT family response regulator